MVITFEDLPEDKHATWLIVYSGEILVHEESLLPPACKTSELTHLGIDATHCVKLHTQDEMAHYLVVMGGACEVSGHIFSPVRPVLPMLAKESFRFVAKAVQYAQFLNTHRFCGQCGSRMRVVTWELATHCDSCKHRCYPRVSPCVIVGIRKENSILLVRSKRHPQGMYSNVAGFVESGESLEFAVHREVEEEVGIKIKNLEYFGSQAWPFPHNLMAGYLAEYDSGDINIDEDELSEAAFFDIDDLPSVPPTVSISGTLVEASIEKIREDKIKSLTQGKA